MIYLYFKIGFVFYTLWFWFICSRNADEVVKTLREGGVIPFVLVSLVFTAFWPFLIALMVGAFFRALWSKG